MSEAKHTPGPWHYVCGGSGDNPTWNVRIGPSMVYLPGAFDMRVMDANAHLIAAAPELLAAAQEAFGDLDSLLDYVGESNAMRLIGAGEAYRRARKTVDVLHAAIAKATA